MRGKSESHSVMSNSLRSYELGRHLYPWNSPGKNTGVGCHFLIQWETKSGQRNGHIPGDGIFKRQYWQIRIMWENGDPARKRGYFKEQLKKLKR